MKRFRTYDLAVAFYRSVTSSTLPYYLKNQLLRAASSAALNIREGAAQRSRPMRRKHYRIAFASIKECQAVFHLEPNHEMEIKADALAAHLYRLLQAVEQ